MSVISNAVIEKSVTVEAAPDLVWLAWTRSDRLTRWFAPQAVIEPWVGGAFELYFIPGNRDSMNTRGCRVVQLQEPQLLEFTWRGPDPFAELMNAEEDLTVVTVTLTQAAEGRSVVQVEHRGFLDGEGWSEARAWHEAAWAQALDSLRQAIETGDGDLCCRP